MFNVRAIPTGQNYQAPFRFAGVAGPGGQDEGGVSQVREWVRKLGGSLTFGAVSPVAAEAVGWGVVGFVLFRLTRALR